MARIALGVTGSVAAVRTAALAQALTAAGHELSIVATEASLHFFSAPEVGAIDGVRLYRDSDEWPVTGYRRGDPVLHIELRKWADILVVAPLDAHTLAKFALGLCDNLLTCLYRAWNFARPVVLAPAMNTLMWDNPVTLRHLQTIFADHGGGKYEIVDLNDAAKIFARHAPNIILIPPESKRLACGDVGIGAMAEVTTIAEAVRAWLDAPSDQSAL